MEKGARQSTRRVLPWHGYGPEYLQGTAKGMGRVMCDWPGVIKEGGHVQFTTGSLSLLKNKWDSPFPRDFYKKKVF
jgi:hypothetical protein